MAETLLRLLDRLGEGHDLQDPELGAFSDLDRAAASDVRGRWPELDVIVRAQLLDRASELADGDVDLNFEALAQIALDDPDPEVRERGVTMLWESTDARVGERLAALAQADPGPGVRAAAALSLQSFVESVVMERVPGSTSDLVITSLKAATGDADVGVQAAAIEAIGALPEEWVSAKIQEAYESEERDLKIAALRAMGASALDRWIEYIEDQLYMGEGDLRLEAVMAAGNLGSELLIEPLAELLTDDDPEVVLAAVLGLGEIGGDEAIEKLQEFQPQAPEDMAEALEAALEMASPGGFRRFGQLSSVLHDVDDEAYDE